MPSVFLQVPRTNLHTQGGSEGWSLGQPWPHAAAGPPGGGGAPGAHGHLLRVVNVGTALATVAPAKAVVVHAVLLLPPSPPLPRLPHNGQAALHGPARGRERAVSPSRPGGQGPPTPRHIPGQGAAAAAGRVHAACGRRGWVTPGPPPGALPSSCSPAQPPRPGQGRSQGEPAEATPVSGQWSCLKAGDHRNRRWPPCHLPLLGGEPRDIGPKWGFRMPLGFAAAKNSLFKAL